MLTRRAVVLRVSVALFVVSALFPVAASVLPADRLPRALGVVDVALAFVVVAIGMRFVSTTPGAFSASAISGAFQIYRALANTFLVLLVLFFTAGESIRWNILLPGLAWRGWLLTMVLPSWLMAWQAESPRNVAS